MKEYMTDEQMFQKLKMNEKTKEYSVLMDANEWKKKRMIELRKTGKNWSK